MLAIYNWTTRNCQKRNRNYTKEPNWNSRSEEETYVVKIDKKIHKLKHENNKIITRKKTENNI